MFDDRLRRVAIITCNREHCCAHAASDAQATDAVASRVIFCHRHLREKALKARRRTSRLLKTACYWAWMAQHKQALRLIMGLPRKSRPLQARLETPGWRFSASY